MHKTQLIIIGVNKLANNSIVAAAKHIPDLYDIPYSTQSV